jgi:hypothetical protein
VARLGQRTREHLLQFGLDDADLEAIENEEVDWDLIALGADDEREGSELILHHVDGGVRGIAVLSRSQVEMLINAWEFEKRTSSGEVRLSTFPQGSYDDWAGIKPNSDWIDLVRGYRAAIDVLANQLPKDSGAPYLYLCRHTLELQLKGIIMLGQEMMDLAYDLPEHHDLQRLWTAAFPIAASKGKKVTERLSVVRRVIDDYHQADPGSFNFRYPVAKGNRPIAHKAFIHAFSLKDHTTAMIEAYDVLDAIIHQMRSDRFHRRLSAAWKRVQAGNAASSR